MSAFGNMSGLGQAQSSDLLMHLRAVKKRLAELRESSGEYAISPRILKYARQEAKDINQALSRYFKD